MLPLPSRVYRFVAFAGVLACRSADAPSLEPRRAAAIADSARRFAIEVARGVSARGPVAWGDYFADDSLFYMAAEGRMVFPSRASARLGIAALSQAIARIELSWGDTIRVDALAPGLALVAAPYRETRADPAGRQVEERGFFTGLAEHRGDRWQLRNAHWSVSTPPPAVP
jgi:hypothetical protein